MNLQDIRNMETLRGIALHYCRSDPPDLDIISIWIRETRAAIFNYVCAYGDIRHIEAGLQAGFSRESERMLAYACWHNTPEVVRFLVSKHICFRSSPKEWQKGYFVFLRSCFPEMNSSDPWLTRLPPVSDEDRMVSLAAVSSLLNDSDKGLLLLLALVCQDTLLEEYLRETGAKVDVKTNRYFSENGAMETSALRHVTCILMGLPPYERMDTLARIEELTGCRSHCASNILAYDRELDERKTFERMLDLKDKPLRIADCFNIILKQRWLDLLDSGKMPIRNTTELSLLETKVRETKDNALWAWYLDFADSPAIRTITQKHEESMMKRLTESPDSVSALSRIWSYHKEGGGIVITGYRGTAERVTVPKMIGKSKVKKLGDEVFSPEAWGIQKSTAEKRKKIVSVVIPEGIREVNFNMFLRCKALKEVILPESLRILDISYLSNEPPLTHLVIPAGTKKIDGSIFSITGISEITVKGNAEIITSPWDKPCKEQKLHVKPGSPAHAFAKEHGLKYDLIGDHDEPYTV